MLNTRLRMFKMLTRTGVLAIPIIVLGQLFIPVYGGVHPLVPSPVAAVADADNTVGDYLEAIREGSRYSQKEALTVADLDGWAKAGFHFSASEIASLERFRPCASLVLAAAKGRDFQFYKKAPTIDSPGIDLLGLRALSRHCVELALADVQRGRLNAGVDLLLATYICGSRFASEKSAPLSQGMSGIGARRQAATGLFYVMQNASLSREQLLHIAREVARGDAMVTTPEHYLDTEAGVFDRYVYTVATEKPEGEMANLPLALRQRCFLQLRQLQSQYCDQRRKSCASYDVVAVTRTEQEWDVAEGYRPTWGFWLSHPYPARLAANAFFTQAAPPSWGRALAVLYLDRSSARGLEALACLRAYRVAHSSYPPTLAAAFDEAGLKVPTDVLTGQPMGYRVEGSNATTWLPGVDGRDDGGKSDYGLRSQPNPTVADHDLLFTTADIPVGFKRPFPANT